VKSSRIIPSAVRSVSGPLGRRRLAEALIVLAICTIAILGLSRAGAFVRADAAVYDALMTVSAPPSPDDRIVLVAIDNRSLEAIGRWPWSRETHARLVDRLTTAGASAVALDILFVEPSADDADLAASMSRSGRVCLPLAVEPEGRNGAAVSEQAPVPLLASAAAGLGQVNLAPDADGVVRRLPLMLEAGRRSWPHLVTCALQTAGLSSEIAADAARSDGVVTARPVGVRFPAGQGAFRTLSYVDVLNSETPPQLLAGRVVLVGMTADGQGDRYATPTAHGVLTPGVEIQAALADTLLSSRAIRPAPSWVDLLLIVTALAILMAAFLLLRPVWGLAVAGALVVALAGLSAGLFVNDVWLPPLAPVAAVALACPLWSWRRLAATSAFMDGELRRFMTQTAAPPADAFDGEDVVGRQTRALHDAVERLRDRSRFIADTLESLPDATVVIDGERTVLYANQKARDLCPPVVLEGSPLDAVLAGLSPDLVSIGDDSGEVRLADGRVLRLDAADLSDGSSRQRIVRLADVTALRAAERQREHALQLLGHDMRAPQTAILALIDSGEATNGRIADLARATLRLADGYVRLARAEAGPLTMEPLGFSDLAVEAADILWPVARARNVTIRVEEDPEIEILGDRGLLGRALMNMIDNAVKHSPPDAEVAITVGRTGRMAWARVRDHGAGLSPHALAELVRPFSHGEEQHAGAGLGLAFVDQVARRHGGELALERGDPGAVFALILPALTSG
jgi:CHASE2 domain-containing sensor protein